VVGGSWGAYWYNGYIYSSELSRGLDVLELTPSEFTCRRTRSTRRSSSSWRSTTRRRSRARVAGGVPGRALLPRPARARNGGLPVDEAGVHEYDIEVRVAGLPEPASLGPYTRYVAWATTPLLRPMIRLGDVSEIRAARGRVAFNQFLVLVSAEGDAPSAERSGPLVLRGMSPSMRLHPLDDPVLLMGAAGPPDDEHAHDTHAAHAGHPGGGTAVRAAAGEWTAPPMEPGVLMPPGMMALQPTTPPFLPAAAGDLQDARPREVMHLRDGDHIELTAGPVRRTIRGRELVMYGYNGQYPGPLLRVAEGTTITVTFRNEIELPGSIHWHGLRLDNRFDGVPHVTQAPVAPGDSFRYVVHFPDAGVYWYHPHHREDITQDLGLYGNMLVDPAADDYWNVVHREELFLLDDLLLAEDGIVPYGADSPTDALMGRFGNVLIVNGEADHRIDVRAREVLRLHFTNASNTRTFNLSLGGVRMKAVGSDLGRFEREAWVNNVVLAPAERASIEVMLPDAGDVALVNRVQAIDHVAGAFRQRTDTVSIIRVAPEPVAPDLSASYHALRTNDDVIRDIDAVRALFERPMDHHLLLTMDARNLPRPVELMMRDDSAYFNPVEWHSTMQMMSWVATAREVEWIVRDMATGLQNMDIDWQFSVGDVVRLRITNEREVIHAMQHPIHIHGQRFLVYARNGEAVDNLAWKDTVLIPVGQTVDLLLELTNPGRWMLHCHIAEHMETGMMMVFQVGPQAADAYRPPAGTDHKH
jgi:suppressor of ftsI